MQLSHPKGDPGIRLENDNKWREVLSRFLVDEATMEAINGGSKGCSSCCLDEELLDHRDRKYQFKDTVRFALANCVHASGHLQCILSQFIANSSYSNCPISDTPQCSYATNAQGKYGEALFWSPEDYYTFARAFLRTLALT